MQLDFNHDVKLLKYTIMKKELMKKVFDHTVLVTNRVENLFFYYLHNRTSY